MWEKSIYPKTNWFCWCNSQEFFFKNLWIVVLEMQPIEYSHVEKELQCEVENSAESGSWDSAQNGSWGFSWNWKLGIHLKVEVGIQLNPISQFLMCEVCTNVYVWRVMGINSCLPLWIPSSFCYYTYFVTSSSLAICQVRLHISKVNFTENPNNC